MTPSNDLAERVARLERLLDGLERSRLAPDRPPGAAAPDALSRLREVSSIVEARRAHPDLDEGDRLAMRALLDELRSIVSELRREAADAGAGMERVRAALDHGDEAMKRLEDAR